MALKEDGIDLHVLGKKLKGKKLLGIFWKYHYHFATSYKDFKKVAPLKTHVCCQFKIILTFYG
jgi:hypothetical protein